MISQLIYEFSPLNIACSCICLGILFESHHCKDMANSVSPTSNKEVRIHDSLGELATDLADYIAGLSEMSVKERGFFAIALSGGSLISMIGYVLVSSPVLVFVQACLLSDFSDKVFGWNQETL